MLGPDETLARAAYMGEAAPLWAPTRPGRLRPLELLDHRCEPAAGFADRIVVHHPCAQPSCHSCSRFLKLPEYASRKAVTTAALIRSANRFVMPKILLVEDNEMNRDMLSRRLNRHGFEVVIAVNGQEGVELAGSAKPDLILMDMSLPVLDGWEATKRVKTDPDTARIPVIALTAHAMVHDKERAMAAGCDDFDTKPVDLPRLLEKINSLLRPAN